MKKEEILKTIESLAKCQGFYSGLQLNDETLEYLEKQNFKDPVDLVLFLEG